MDQQQITKQIMDFNKTVLEKTFVYTKTEKLLSRFFEKALQYPETEKNVINKCVKPKLQTKEIL